MVLWELGKERASLFTREVQALEEREHSLLGSFSPITSVCENDLLCTHCPILSKGGLSCFSSLSCSHWGEDSDVTVKLELRNKKIQAGLLAGRRKPSYVSLGPSSNKAPRG